MKLKVSFDASAVNFSIKYFCCVDTVIYEGINFMQI